MKEAGYAFLYVSNEHPTFTDVYFDDVKMTYTPSGILQYNEYYPFGLQTAQSWTRDNTSNNFLYDEGSELNSTSGFYDLPYRNYDPAVGRFFQVDPLAIRDHNLTPYQYSRNNPLTYHDPSGAFEEYVPTDESGNGWSEDDGGGGGAGTGYDPNPPSSMNPPDESGVISKCDKCDKNDPNQQDFINDPNRTFVPDASGNVIEPSTGNVYVRGADGSYGLLLNEVTVSDKVASQGDGPPGFWRNIATGFSQYGQSWVNMLSSSMNFSTPNVYLGGRGGNGKGGNPPRPGRNSLYIDWDQMTILSLSQRQASGATTQSARDMTTDKENWLGPLDSFYDPNVPTTPSIQYYPNPDNITYDSSWMLSNGIWTTTPGWHH